MSTCGTFVRPSVEIFGWLDRFNIQRQVSTLSTHVRVAHIRTPHCTTCLSTQKCVQFVKQFFTKPPSFSQSPQPQLSSLETMPSKACYVAALVASAMATGAQADNVYVMSEQGQSCASACGIIGRTCNTLGVSNISTDIFSQASDGKIVCNQTSKDGKWWAPGKSLFFRCAAL